MTILRDALSILARWFGLRPGPDVNKLPEPPRQHRSWQQEQWDALGRPQPPKQEKKP